MSQPLGLLYYLDEYPSLSQSFVLNELVELDRRGHDLAVFAREDPGDAVDHHEVADLDIPVGYAGDVPALEAVRRVTSRVFHPGVWRHALARARPQDHVAAWHHATECLAFVKGLDAEIDLVHTHFATWSRLAALLVAGSLGVPCTVTTHAYDLYNDPNRRHLRHVLERVDRIVTISVYNRRYIERDLGVDTPVDVVRAGIRPEKFAPTGATHDARLLTVARFVEKKGIPDAIDAVARLVEDHPTLEYHIVGAGPMEAQIRERIAAHGLEEVVSLLGHVDDDRLIREYDEATCFVLPCVIAASGDRDGIPIVLMEAMAMETPPVTTRVSGIPELVTDGESGIVVEPGAVDTLAAAIDRLLRDPQRRAAFGRAGRETVERDFNVATACAELEGIFRRLGP